MEGGSGDADLYVRKDAWPTSSSYHCRPWLDAGQLEECVFTVSGDTSTYYVSVYGYASFSSVTLTIDEYGR